MAKVVNYEPRNAYNIPDEIEAGKNIELSHGNMQLKVRYGDIITPYQTLFTMYHNILTPYIRTIKLSEDDYYKYYQKPKLFSYDYYGTYELWSGLLYINNMVSVTNFTKRTIKVFTTDIIDALEEIMTIYNEDLNNNKREIYKN